MTQRNASYQRKHNKVLDLLNALSKPGDALKKIKEIRKRQKGENEETDETAVSLTVGRAAEFLKAAIIGAAKSQTSRRYSNVNQMAGDFCSFARLNMQQRRTNTRLVERWKNFVLTQLRPREALKDW
jgi:hypothetical protein